MENKLEVIVKGEKYPLNAGDYDVIGELDRELVSVGAVGRRKALVIRQLCKVRDAMRFFILGVEDYSTWDREKVTVCPVSVESAKRLAEDLVFADKYEEFFGKVEADEER